jgi:hypothetical protein
VLTVINRKRLRISRNKIEYIEYDFGERCSDAERMMRHMTISYEVIGEVENFKLLGLFV